MGMENDVMLEFLREDHRFADLFNGGLFGGEPVVKAEDLVEAGETYTEFREETAPKAGDDSKSKSAQKKIEVTVTRGRDIKKRLKSGTELRILAIEDQSLIDYTMPWRCMNYDALEYGRQVKLHQGRNEEKNQYRSNSERLCKFLKEDRLAPVYTLCLYHGTEHWDGPRSLKEMMSFGSDEEKAFWEKQFFDYGMRLVCVNELENHSVFKTSLKELFAIMAYRKDKKGMDQFLAEHEEYRRLDEETARAIGTVMGVRTFMENNEQFKEGEGYNMCQAIREMWEDGLNEGISRGISQGLSQGISQGISQGVNLSAAVFSAVRSGLTDSHQIAVLCECTIDEVEQIRKAFGI